MNSYLLALSAIGLSTALVLNDQGSSVDEYALRAGKVATDTTKALERLGFAWNHYRERNSEYEWQCQTAEGSLKPICIKVIMTDAIPATDGWVAAITPYFSFMPRPPAGQHWNYSASGTEGAYFCASGVVDLWVAKELQQVRYNFPEGVVTLATECGVIEPGYSVHPAAGQTAVTFWVEEFYQLTNYPFPDYTNPGVGDPVPPSENQPSNVVLDTLLESSYSPMYQGSELESVSSQIKQVLDSVDLASLHQSETNKIRQFIKDSLKSIGWPANDRNSRAVQTIERYRYCQQQGVCSSG